MNAVIPANAEPMRNEIANFLIFIFFLFIFIITGKMKIRI